MDTWEKQFSKHSLVFSLYSLMLNTAPSQDQLQFSSGSEVELHIESASNEGGLGIAVSFGVTLGPIILNLVTGH